MSRTVLIVLITVVLGALILFGIGWIMQNQDLIQQIPVTSPVPQQEDTTAMPGEVTPTQEELDRLRTQLFEEGITVQAMVDETFPGMGFIVRDESGERLFVRWMGAMPEENQNVTLRGTVQRITGQEEFRQEAGFSPRLESFLQDQRVYIEAQEVTPQ